MIDKCELMKTAIDSFTKFGSKRYTLDELASSIGISKKTIYKHFRSILYFCVSCSLSVYLCFVIVYCFLYVIIIHSCYISYVY